MKPKPRFGYMIVVLALVSLTRWLDERRDVSNFSTFRGTSTRPDSGGKKMVHVVYAAEGVDQSVGLSASIVSLLTNAVDPKAVTIHIFRLQSVHDSKSISTLSQGMPDESVMEWVSSTAGAIHVHDYTAEEVAPFVNTHTHNERLKSPANYVRFLLPSRLPDVDSCLWIDADTTVEDDIVSFLLSLGSSYALAAFPRKSHYIEEASVAQLRRNGVDVEERFPTFNAGIVVFNLKMWREYDIEKDILRLCDLNRNLNLWPDFGSQPPLQLLFSGDGRFEQLDRNLLVGNLGYEEDFLGKIRKYFKENPKRALFLHWNGPFKPWQGKGLFQTYWKKYDPRIRLNET